MPRWDDTRFRDPRHRERADDEAELRREAAEQEAEWRRAGHCPACGGPDDEPDGCRCWGARLAGVEAAAEDDLPF